MTAETESFQPTRSMTCNGGRRLAKRRYDRFKYQMRAWTTSVVIAELMKEAKQK